jgi:hypothetical protein
MLTATCHCGAVKVTVPRKPRTVTDCNCTICRQYGVLWAYYKESTVTVEASAGATDEYRRGRKIQRFVRCANCGCVMYWQRLAPHPQNNMGVNARNFPPEILSKTPVRQLDGAAF